MAGLSSGTREEGKCREVTHHSHVVYPLGLSLFNGLSCSVCLCDLFPDAGLVAFWSYFVKEHQKLSNPSGLPAPFPLASVLLRTCAVAGVG